MSKGPQTTIRDLESRGLGHWIKGENDRIAVERGCWIQPEVGEYVCRWIEKHCRISDSSPPGQPFKLMDWQRNDVIMPLFSWFMFNGQGRPIRRFRRLKAFLPIRMGKTVFMAALAWYLLKGDFHLDTRELEPSPRVFSAANDRDQAALIYNEMAGMIRYSPHFQDATALDSKKKISITNTSFYLAMSADAKTSAGYNGHVIIDEIALFNEAGRRLRDELKGRGDNRLQPIEAMISRAGEDSGIGWEEYEEARKVKLGPSAGGIEDITTLPVIYQADAKCDITDPEQHRKANPSLGVLVDPQKFMLEAIAAKQSPRLAAQFRMQRLGIWGGSIDPWLDAAKWKTYGTDLDEAELKGLPCCGGLDLSSTTDLSAWALTWKRPDGTFIIRVRFWLPLDNIVDRIAQDGIDYRTMQQHGYMTLTPGSEIDYSYIAAQIADDWVTYKIHQVGFDKYLAPMLLSHMKTAHGIGDAENEEGKRRGMVAVPQLTPYLHNGSKALEDAVNITGKILHDGNPIMARHVATVQTYTDTHGKIRPVKCDSAKHRVRIDGVAATVNALSRLLVMKERKGGLTFA